jgi:hypothetical protein
MDDGYKQQKLYITHHVLQRLLHQVKHPAGSNTSGRRHRASIDLPWLRSGRQQAASNAAKYLFITIALRFPRTCVITSCHDHQITRGAD